MTRFVGFIYYNIKYESAAVFFCYFLSYALLHKIKMALVVNRVTYGAGHRTEQLM